MNSSDCIPGCQFYKRIKYGERGKSIGYRCLSPKIPEKRYNRAPGYEIKFLESCPEVLPEPCNRVDCGFNYQGESCAVIPELSKGNACKTFTLRRCM